MPQYITQFAVTVRDYDEAIAFYVGKLGFTLLEDSDLGQGKRWVRVMPPTVAAAPATDGASGGPASKDHFPHPGTAILLARAATPEQLATVGNQTGGRVFVFLETDDFWRDYNAMTAKGVVFVRPASEEPFGTVAVFQDLYGNKFDLIQRRAMG
ncbi:MAG: VOC family protein [Pyrinomonadaceae bacterium]|nr:VOC family protein [Phycisphaerales bacterium]